MHAGSGDDRQPVVGLFYWHNVTEKVANQTHRHTQPFHGPFSRTTQVSQCQKKTSGLLWCKVCKQRYFIFPPHLMSAFALPVETGNPEIASFHLNAACFLPKTHKTH